MDTNILNVSKYDDELSFLHLLFVSQETGME